MPTGMKGIQAVARTACSSQVGKGHIIMSVIPLVEPPARIPASQGALSIIGIVISDHLTVGSEDILLQLNTELNQQHWLLAVPKSMLSAQKGPR